MMNLNIYYISKIQDLLQIKSKFKNCFNEYSFVTTRSSSSSSTQLSNDGDKLYLKYDISYKPENISPKFNGTVLELLSKIVSK